MSKLRVSSFSISIDGFGVGPNQDTENPLGVGGLKVFDWFFPTRTWQRMHGNDDGETGVDDTAAQGVEGTGAYILGRNMFGPMRGRWPDKWKGLWRDEPPYHTPCFCAHGGLVVYHLANSCLVRIPHVKTPAINICFLLPCGSSVRASSTKGGCG
jgi:hypothetical protein